MSKVKVSAVIFDLDDTLISTIKLNTYRESGDRNGLSENISKSFVYKPVKHILEEINKLDIPCAIVTNSPKWYVTALLEYHELDFFDCVTCYDDVGPGGIKPSSKGINIALSKLDVSAKNTIYIGDQDTDIIAAYTAGVKPIVPSWASRRPVDQVPAAIINSETLIANLEDFEELSLIADRTAFYRAFDFPKKQLNFLPLNSEGQVVALNKEDVKLIAFGRYFSQTSPITAILHENHQLSKDIYAKEKSKTYIIPQYYVDLVSRAVEVLPAYIFSENEDFDIITVVPAKKFKNGRLENFLRRISAQAESNAEFIPDIFEFSSNAVSLKTLGGKEARASELESNLNVKSKHIGKLAGKKVLVIDDVITTSATFNRVFSLLESESVSSHFGICLAKTVSVSSDMKFCSECGRIMRVRSTKDGTHFYGCTGYFEDSNRCTHTESIPVKDCPRCGKKLFKKYSPRYKSHFLSCESYGTPGQCGYTENVDEI